MPFSATVVLREMFSRGQSSNERSGDEKIWMKDWRILSKKREETVRFSEEIVRTRARTRTRTRTRTRSRTKTKI